MDDKFKIRLCSDLDYEEMVADITYENRTIAMVTQEKGINNMEIEILITGNQVNDGKFPLDAFVKAVEDAKNNLIRMQKLPD